MRARSKLDIEHDEQKKSKTHLLTFIAELKYDGLDSKDSKPFLCSSLSLESWSISSTAFDMFPRLIIEIENLACADLIFWVRRSARMSFEKKSRRVWENSEGNLAGKFWMKNVENYYRENFQSKIQHIDHVFDEAPTLIWSLIISQI